MKHLISIISFSIVTLLFGSPANAKDPIRVIHGIVIKVSDGDTIQVQDGMGTKVKVRLYGIDSPETEKRNRKTGGISKAGQPFGKEALDALKGKVSGKMVKLDVIGIDRYKRSASIVWVDNRNINIEMVKEGHAWAYKQYLDRPYASEYIAAEEQARKQKIGLWQQGVPQAPWEFRKQIRGR